jgi:hypothetical protein
VLFDVHKSGIPSIPFIYFFLFQINAAKPNFFVCQYRIIYISIGTKTDLIFLLIFLLKLNWLDLKLRGNESIKFMIRVGVARSERIGLKWRKFDNGVHAGALFSVISLFSVFCMVNKYFYKDMKIIFIVWKEFGFIFERHLRIHLENRLEFLRKNY